MSHPKPVHLPAESNHAVMTAGSDGTFSILQLTDFHTDVDSEANRRTWRDVRLLAGHFEPDLLAVTGDLWCGDAHPSEAPAWMERDLHLLGDLGLPWAFAWGNHDYCDDLSRALERIADTPHAVAPRGDGGGNYRIEIQDRNSGAVLWDVYFLNSHTECLLPEDLTWFEHEASRARNQRDGRDRPAVLFFHIPLKPYETARVDGRYTGIALEEVLFWGDDGSLFPRLRAAADIRACFVGHDHLNDFYTVEEGVVLAYGRVTGHGGYGADRVTPGGKLITLDGGSGEFRFTTVFPDGLTWNPGP